MLDSKAIEGLQASIKGSTSVLDQNFVNRARWVLSLCLMVWVLWLLAHVVWYLFPEPALAPLAGDQINIGIDISVEADRDDVDIDTLVSWELFGSAVLEEQPALDEQLSDAEANAGDTKLDVILRGVVLSDKLEDVQAMIEYKKKQAAYGVDDALPVSGRVVVSKIRVDRVLLNNSGRYEWLYLFDQQSGQPGFKKAAAPAPSRVLDHREDTEVTELATDYRKQLYANPNSLAEVIKITPVRQDGAVLGYRVAPGRNKVEFERIGLKSGDVITSVNGITLDNPSNTIELYRAMRSAESASFTLQRGEEEISLVVGLNP